MFLRGVFLLQAAAAASSPDAPMMTLDRACQVLGVDPPNYNGRSPHQGQPPSSSFVQVVMIDKQTLKKAFRQAVKVAHPDLPGGSETRMKEVVAAMKFLMSINDHSSSSAQETVAYEEYIRQQSEEIRAAEAAAAAEAHRASFWSRSANKVASAVSNNPFAFAGSVVTLCAVGAGVALRPRIAARSRQRAEERRLFESAAVEESPKREDEHIHRQRSGKSESVTMRKLREAKLTEAVKHLETRHSGAYTALLNEESERFSLLHDASVAGASEALRAERVRAHAEAVGAERRTLAKVSEMLVLLEELDSKRAGTGS